MSLHSPVRFGIVGCGSIGPTHADAITAIEDAVVVACCDEVPERAQQFAERFNIGSDHIYTSYADFLADASIDIVTVCTPSGMHAEMAIAALKAGKPVIVEKPMDVTVEACNALQAAQKASGLAVGVISQHRFDRASETVRNLLATNAIGKLVLVEAQVKWYRTQEYYDSGSWRGTWALDGGGALMNQGVHTADIMRWLAGPVESVYAVARTSAHERIETEDIVCATLTFKNGAIGNLVASTAAYPGFPATISLHGTEGSIVISGDMLQTVATKQPIDTVATSEEAAAHALQVAQGGTKSAEAEKAGSGAADPAGIWGDAHKAQIIDFISAVRDGRTPLVDALAGREAVEVVTAIYESARTGKVVTL